MLHLPLRVVPSYDSQIRIACNRQCRLEAEAVERRPGNKDYMYPVRYCGCVTDNSKGLVPFFPLISFAKTVATSSAVVEDPKLGEAI
jgi:hypothetical protein